jgi:uncharacterized protein (TIGR02598 family)
MNYQSPRHSRRPAAARRAGFTLVEVTVAIGIVAFAMIGMLGLLPVGLTTFQEASTTSIRAQIVQAITSDIARSDSSNISTGTHYFDNEGNSLETNGPKTVYTAVVNAADLVELANLGVSKESGRRVTIKVTNIRTQKAGGPNAEVTYPIIVPTT